MKYRPEIDGLRSLAVLPVILFHAGFTFFSGGFVGVDVFFVISGYLITTILLSEMEQNKFSLVTFYERRARRILPALFFIMLVSSIFAYLILPPIHMADFSQSLISISLFSSNILFWQETGYWGVENELKPLLHTWSLAVEEQYYLLFPLFLMLMWGFRKRWLLSSFVLMVILSFLLSQFLISTAPSANFFLLPSRAWELAMGSLVAFYFLYRQEKARELSNNTILCNWMALIGIGLISYSIVKFDENTPFPGAYALIPTIGTVLIIMFGNARTFVGRVLSSKPLVGIGLISYSAYLWHQPMFAFAKHYSTEHPSLTTFLILSLLSLLFAALTWKYIEAPFRNNKKISKAKIFQFSLLGSLCFVVIGLLGHFTDGMKFRFDSKILNQIEIAQKKTFNKSLCTDFVDNRFGDQDVCVLAKNGPSSAFLYGDSHADALMSVAKTMFESSSLSLYFSSKSSCPPVLGVYRRDHTLPTECVIHNQSIYEFIESDDQIQVVILTARWALGLEGSRFDNLEGGVEHGRPPLLDVIKNGEYQISNETDRKKLVSDAYTRSVKRLVEAGKYVILIYPVPEVGWDAPDYFFKSYIKEPSSLLDSSLGSTSYKVYLERNARVIEVLNQLDVDKNVSILRPDQELCNSVVPERCVIQLDGVLLYRDDDHLSDAGAELILNRLNEMLNRLNIN